MRKKLILTVASIAVLTGFFFLPANRSWLQSRIFPYYNNLPYQWRHQSIESRKTYRWTSDYTYAKRITDLADSVTPGSRALVLVPPSQYFRDRGVNFHVPEPAVFYYYTGLRTTCAHCDSANAARWYIRVQNKSLTITKVENDSSLQSLIDSLKKYKPEL